MALRILAVILLMTYIGTVNSTKSKVKKENNCCLTFEYTITNQLVGDFFTETTTLLAKAGKPLIRHMEDAVRQNPNRFKNFVAKYSSPYGFIINSVNDLAGDWVNNHTWWKFLDENGPLPVGISTYVPKPCDHITLSYTNETEHP